MFITFLYSDLDYSTSCIVYAIGRCDSLHYNYLHSNSDTYPAIHYLYETSLLTYFI